jgi:hypothetical protein
MLRVFAEFETNLRKERQAEGIAKAKAAGVYKGRPPSVDIAKVRDLKKKGLGASEIAKALKIGRASVYRALLSAPSGSGSETKWCCLRSTHLWTHGVLVTVTDPFRQVCETRRERKERCPAPPIRVRWHPIRSDRGSCRRHGRSPNVPCLFWCRGGVLHL